MLFGGFCPQVGPALPDRGPRASLGALGRGLSGLSHDPATPELCSPPFSFASAPTCSEACSLRSFLPGDAGSIFLRSVAGIQAQPTPLARWEGGWGDTCFCSILRRGRPSRYSQLIGLRSFRGRSLLFYACWGTVIHFIDGRGEGRAEREWQHLLEFCSFVFPLRGWPRSSRSESRSGRRDSQVLDRCWAQAPPSRLRWLPTSSTSCQVSR